MPALAQYKLLTFTLATSRILQKHLGNFGLYLFQLLLMCYNFAPLQFFGVDSSVCLSIRDCTHNNHVMEILGDQTLFQVFN